MDKKTAQELCKLPYIFCACVSFEQILPLCRIPGRKSDLKYMVCGAILLEN